MAEVVLGKRRILEIYLNVVEWGPGIYGAESACRYYDRTSARNIGREQAARLAAILPAPRKRRPERMDNYSDLILQRIRQMGGNREQHFAHAAPVIPLALGSGRKPDVIPRRLRRDWHQSSKLYSASGDPRR